MRERRRIQQRLECGARLPSAAPRAIELRLAKVAASNHRENVSRCRIDRDERRLQLLVPAQAHAVLDSALPRSLQLRHERRLDGPGGRVIAAEPIAELL